MKKMLNKIHTGILLILAAGTPVLVVVSEQYWFEKRVALAVAAVVLLALWASRVWVEGRAGIAGKAGETLGWGLLGAAMVVAACLPAGRVANLATPDLWVGLGAVVARLASTSSAESRRVKLGFAAVLIGLVAAAGLVAAGIGGAGIAGGAGSITEQGKATLKILQRSPIWGEFREFRVAGLGILQTASGLGILGILGVLGISYQLVAQSAKAFRESGNVWVKLLNLLVLVFLAGFLVLPHPALTLWPLAVVAALAGGVTTVGGAGEAGGAGTIKRAGWAGFVGLLIVAVLGSSYGLGRVVWGEMKFREALAAANRNEGITTYYALREAIKRNPYEVRYRLLASQIDIALANSIAATAGERGEQGEQEEATESAQLTVQDQNNILILIQEAVVEGKAAIKLDPENSLLWQNLASIYRALVGVAGGAEDWALKCYQRAAELAPADPNPPLQLGTIHLFGGNYQGAVEEFEKAIKIKSDWAPAHYNLAVVLNAMGEIDRAIEELQKTLDLLPTDSPDREQVEKDLGFLGGDRGEQGEQGKMEIETEGTGETEELKEATTSAEVEAPPPPVGPEATESGKPEEQEVPEGLEE